MTGSKRLGGGQAVPPHNMPRTAGTEVGRILERGACCCVHELFEEQAGGTPDALALVAGDLQLTYRELNSRSNRLASHLRGLGVGPEVLVGIFAERSANMIVAILAILKAGGAYVPVDPNLPRDRRDGIIGDSGLGIMVGDSNFLPSLPHSVHHVVSLDPEMSCAAAQSPANLPRGTARSDGLAYVIYTSGSTGAPKGVLVQHDSLMDFVRSARMVYGVGPRDRVLQFASLSFDASIEEIFSCLTAGGTLFLRDDAMLASQAAFLETCRAWGITVLDLPTAFWHELTAALASGRAMVPPSVRLVIIGGEKALPSRLAQWRNHAGENVRLLNTYGPTETTVVATAWEMPAGNNGWRPGDEVPIGQPLPHVRICILDDDGKRVAKGRTGELVVGGSCVARGYLNRPVLTAQRFGADSSDSMMDSRFYRTGDLVKETPEGDLLFVGRKDDQVKIRGFRVELGEIESILRKQPGVRDAAAVARDEEHGQRRIVAYIVADGVPPPSVKALRSSLKTVLPEYMVPSFFVFLQSLPMNAAGKVDRAALPAADSSRPELDETYVPPQDHVEISLASIWGELLGLTRIGANDSFFDLGGHSLLVMQLIARVREQFRVDLPFRFVFEHPTISSLAWRLRTDGPGSGQETVDAITPVPRGGSFPLSYSQEGVWFFLSLQPGNVAYNSPALLRFKGALNVGALQETLNELVRRHEIFRTSFHEEKGRPVQVIHPPRPCPLPVVDIGRLPEPLRQAEAGRLVSEEVRRPFDLATFPLIRWTLLTLGGDESLLILVEHHFVHDGWSFNMLLGEFAKLYSAFSAGHPSPLGDIPVQFVDYVVWQRKWMEGSEAKKQMDYWMKKLAGCPPHLELPTDRPRPAVQRFRGSSITRDLPADLYFSLQRAGRREGLSLYMTMLAGFLMLLHRYSGKDDFCVGSGVANRRRREAEAIIGMIVNTVAIRVSFAGDPSLRELLGRVRQACLEAYAHQEVPFEKIVEALNPVRSLSFSPIYQVLFGFHDSPMSRLDLPGLATQLTETVSNGSAKSDLNVIIIPRSEQHVRERADASQQGITIVWEYDTDLFDAGTMERMLTDYAGILEQCVEEPDLPVAELNLLDEEERRKILDEWNSPQEASVDSAAVHTLIEERAATSPDSPAMSLGQRRLSYRELNTRANIVARTLGSVNVKRGDIVGVCMERSIESVVAFLGILKAGAVYLPLDPSYPTDRLKFMIEDSGAAGVLVTAALPWLDRPGQIPVGAINERGDRPGPGSDRNPETSIRPDDAAYVIYTSGSTGTPKGVSVPHGAIARHCLACRDLYGITPADRVLQFSSMSFDASIEQILTTLISGAELVMRGPEVWTPGELLRVTESEGLTVVNLPTAYWRQLLRTLETDGGNLALPLLRLMIVGGEEMRGEWLEAWHRSPLSRVRLLNAYGPTEATITALTFDCSSTVHAPGRGIPRIPVGRPLGPRTAYVLDTRARPVPVGVHGELYIGGPCLASGYLQRPELTAGRFVPDPFVHGGPGRLYRTGDRARYLPDGNIEFLGRLDDQLKIRGYRVEPAEIESALAGHPAVRDAVVIAREDGRGEKMLMAFWTAGSVAPPEEKDLRDFLRRSLPGYMVPSAFMMLDSFPLSPAGKIDRDALSSMNVAPGAARGQASAASPTERTLGALWSEILGREHVAPQENFFDLGGHSLLAMQLVSRIRGIWKIDVTLVSIFEHPTLERLSGFIEETLTREINTLSDEEASRAQLE